MVSVQLGSTLDELPRDIVHFLAAALVDGSESPAAMVAFACSCCSLRAHLSIIVEQHHAHVRNSLSCLFSRADASVSLRSIQLVDRPPFESARALGHALGAAAQALQICIVDASCKCEHSWMWKLPLVDLDCRATQLSNCKRRIQPGDLAFLAGLTMRDAGRNGHMLHLEDLAFGNVVGALALPMSLASGRSLATHLSRVWLANCRITDSDLAQLALALERGSPGLSHLCVSSNAIHTSGLQALSAVLAAGGLPRLCEIMLDNNGIDDIASLTAAIATGHVARIQWLELSNNKLDGRAASGLAAAVAAGGLPRLQVLALEGNPGITRAALQSLEAALSSASALTDDLSHDLTFACCVEPRAPSAARTPGAWASPPPSPSPTRGWMASSPASPLPRFPLALVWTPTHPLTWIAPYVGHFGVTDSSGVIYDFSGDFFVGEDSMGCTLPLRGWPTRCLELAVADASAWDTALRELKYRYEQQGYDFISWNCASFVAGLLNATHQPLTTKFSACFGRWTVVAVAALFFTQARHVGGVVGWLRSWGGHVLLWSAVIARAAVTRSFAPVAWWLITQLGLLIYFFSWYAALALLGHASQSGLGTTSEWTKALPPGFHARQRRIRRQVVGGDICPEEIACCLANPSV